MNAVASSRYGWMRLATAAIGFALLLLGLGIATSTGTAIAKKQGKKGGKSVTKTYVAHSRTDSDASAIVKAKLNPAGVPVRVKMVRVVNVDGACTATSPALIVEPIETTYKYPGSLKVTTKKVRGKTVREFKGASSADGKATAVSGQFVRGGVSVSFTQQYPTAGPVIFGIPIALDCDTTLALSTAEKPPRDKGERPGGKTRDRGTHTR